MEVEIQSTTPELGQEVGGKPALKPYRVLSLDGGGMRGIYTAEFLDRLTCYFARSRNVDTLDLGKGFDLITGAIVACALAVGKPLSEVVELYREHGPHTFPHRIKGTASALFRAFFLSNIVVRRGDKALREALDGVLADATMLEVYQRRGISLSIPTVSMKTHRAWVFKKTPASGVRDDLYPLVDVCMASSAAPIFRSLAAIDNPMAKYGLKQIFADGGLWANNPILVGLIDALQVAAPEQPIEIFSLGTCSRPEGEHISPRKAHRSMPRWKLGADVAPLSITAQEFAFDNMARFLSNILTKAGRPVKTLRFPKKDVPAEMMPLLALDDARKQTMDRLIQQANSDADITKSACDDARNPDGQMVKAFDDGSTDHASGRLQLECPMSKNNHIQLRHFHDDEVRMNSAGRKDILDRAKSNRTRLRNGLARDLEPDPVGSPDREVR